jgi:predicted nucleic acid-binding protein
MPFVVVYDACVLYPASLRDLLVRLASKRIVHACWSRTILEEMRESLLANHPQLRREQLNRTLELMDRNVPEAMTEGFEDLIPALSLPDPDDRHVLAVAIRAGAQAIITANLRDFPPKALALYDIEALHPDTFILQTLDLYPGAVCETLTEQVADLRAPPIHRDQVLERLSRCGLIQSVTRFREILGADRS